MNFFLYFLCCLVLVALLAAGVFICHVIAATLTYWGLFGLLVACALAWAFCLFRKDKHAAPIRWYIIQDGTPTTWGSAILEFDDEKSARRFAKQLHDLWDIEYTLDRRERIDAPAINATNLKPKYIREADASFLDNI